MGTSADDRLTEQATARFAGAAGQGPHGPHRRWFDEAAEMAETEGMKLEDALMIVTGASRPPYGSPRRAAPKFR